MSELQQVIPGLNKSGIYPVGFKVLVVQEKFEEKTTGGILIPLDTQEKEQWKISRCQIVDMGPRAFEEPQHDLCRPVTGDWVLIREYAGFKVQGLDGEYHLINDNDIMAIWRGE